MESWWSEGFGDLKVEEVVGELCCALQLSIRVRLYEFVSSPQKLWVY